MTLATGTVPRARRRWDLERIIALAVLLAIVGAFVLSNRLSRAANRRRGAWVEQLTAAFGATRGEAGEGDESRHFRFGERDFDLSVRYHGGGGLGANTPAARYVTLRTPLAGRGWDLHSVTIRQHRRKGSFEERIRVKEFGLPMREGWLSERVRTSMIALYDLVLPDGDLLIEEGALSYRMVSEVTKIQPEAFRALVEGLAALAGALEREYR